MRNFLVILLLLLISPLAFAQNNHIPGCCKVCSVDEQACGDECISKNKKCMLAVKAGCACDQTYLDKQAASKTQCCQYRQGVCGCTGERVLCCDGSPSDICGCDMLLYEKTNPRLYSDMPTTTY